MCQAASKTLSHLAALPVGAPGARHVGRPSGRAALALSLGSTCTWCGCELTLDTAQLDHLVPCSHGGTWTLANLVPACGTCNNARKDLPLARWIRKIAAKLAAGRGATVRARAEAKAWGRVWQIIRSHS